MFVANLLCGLRWLGVPAVTLTGAFQVHARTSPGVIGVSSGIRRQRLHGSGWGRTPCLRYSPCQVERLSGGGGDLVTLTNPRQAPTVALEFERLHGVFGKAVLFVLPSAPKVTLLFGVKGTSHG